LILAVIADLHPINVFGLMDPNIATVLAAVQQCTLCWPVPTGSACSWVHPETGYQVEDYDMDWYDLCVVRDAYFAAPSTFAEQVPTLPEFLQMKSVAWPFLENGSFSYYDLTCATESEWGWTAAARHRLDAVALIRQLLPELLGSDGKVVFAQTKK
jgi:hypothetical protein